MSQMLGSPTVREEVGGAAVVDAVGVDGDVPLPLLDVVIGEATVVDAPLDEEVTIVVVDAAGGGVAAADVEEVAFVEF